MSDTSVDLNLATKDDVLRCRNGARRLYVHESSGNHIVRCPSNTSADTSRRQDGFLTCYGGIKVENGWDIVENLSLTKRNKVAEAAEKADRKMQDEFWNEIAKGMQAEPKSLVGRMRQTASCLSYNDSNKTVCAAKHLLIEAATTLERLDREHRGMLQAFYSPAARSPVHVVDKNRPHDPLLSGEWMANIQIDQMSYRVLDTIVYRAEDLGKKAIAIDDKTYKTYRVTFTEYRKA